MILQGKTMRDRYEQVEMYSKAEFHRRAEIVREELRRESLKAAIVVNPANEGWECWLTGKEFMEYVIVPVEGEIIGVLFDEIDESGYEDKTDTVDFDRYVHQHKFVTNADNVRFINRISDAGIAQMLIDRCGSRIGLINAAFLTCGLEDALKSINPDACFVDITRQIAVRKTQKSEEELESVKMAGIVQGQMMEALEHMLRPGRHLKEIRTEVRDQIVALGAGGFLHCMLIWLGNQDEVSPPFDPFSDDVIVRKGDRFFALYEANSYGGHCTAMGRVFILGKASEEYRKAIEFAADNNRFAASCMKPGVTLKEIRAKTEAFAGMKGHKIKRMCWIHGLSVSTYGEVFYMNDESDTWPLTDGALLHCHPISTRYMPWVNGGAWEEAWELNTYVVTPEGGKSLVKYPLGLTEIDIEEE